MFLSRGDNNITYATGIADGYELHLAEDINISNYTNPTVVMAVDGYLADSENYALDSVLAQLELNPGSEATTLQNTVIDPANYDIAEAFEIHITADSTEYLDPINDGTVEDSNGYFEIQISALANQDITNYLFMIVNSNIGDVYFYEIQPADFDSSQGVATFYFNQFL